MAFLVACCCPTDHSANFHDDEAILNDTDTAFDHRDSADRTQPDLIDPPVASEIASSSSQHSPPPTHSSPFSSSVIVPPSPSSSSSSTSSSSSSSSASSSSSSSSSSRHQQSSSSSKHQQTRNADTQLSDKVDQVLGLSSEVEDLIEKVEKTSDGHVPPTAQNIEQAKQALLMLVKLLRVLPSSQLRCLVISTLLSREVTALCQAEPGPYFNRPSLQSVQDSLQSSAKATFFGQLALCLTGRDKLAKLICHLPPAILGDQDLKDQTRVFIDLEADTVASVRNEKGRAVRKYTPATIELANTVADNIHQLLASDQLLDLLSVLQPPSHQTSHQQLKWLTFVSLMPQITPVDRERIFLQQLLMSKLLPYDLITREELVHYILPS